MTDKQTFFLRNEQVRSNCQAFIQDLPTDDKKPLVIKIQPMTRNLEQNAKFHAMCGDVAAQCEFMGKKLSMEGAFHFRSRDRHQSKSRSCAGA